MGAICWLKYKGRSLPIGRGEGEGEGEGGVADRRHSITVLL